MKVDVLIYLIIAIICFISGYFILKKIMWNERERQKYRGVNLARVDKKNMISYLLLCIFVVFVMIMFKLLLGGL